MEMAERRSMTVQFLRPAQVDGAGNANTSRIRDEHGSVRRLPGGLATADVWRILPRVVVYHTDHRERSLPDKVAFVTGAGGGDRERGTRGPTVLVTDRAVFRFTPGGGVRLESLHPGEELERVASDTGFHFDVGDAVATTAAPSGAELSALEQVDRQAIRELELRETRHAAAARLASH
jgi:glutaconate CoA-transferase subunit B